MQAPSTSLGSSANNSLSDNSLSENSLPENPPPGKSLSDSSLSGSSLSGTPFWLGIDPAKPERLDKILATVHCFHVAPPTDTYYEFTVDPVDRHRIHNGFPELQVLKKYLGSKRISYVGTLFLPPRLGTTPSPTHALLCENPFKRI